MALVPFTFPGSFFEGEGLPLEATTAELFTPKLLKKAWDLKISRRATRGIDGITLPLFDFEKESAVVMKKCVDGSYTFAPYLQKLVLKGKGKPPREISIPTIRDQLVLYLLKEYLHHVFPECIGTTLPNKYVRDIFGVMVSEKENASLCFSKFDIEDFYGTIHHGRMFELISKKVKCEVLQQLLFKAVKNVTVSGSTRRKDFKSLKHSKGVPQGLSISNILANIYIEELDKEISKSAKRYFRYVDDILIFNSGEPKTCLKPAVGDKMKEIHLSLSTHKTCCKDVRPSFDYLGYHFNYPKLSIKKENVDKFLRSIASKFTSYKYKKNYVLDNHKWMTPDIYENIFVEELNIRITGAISNKKRYGWIFYYLEMNDLTLLKSLDKVIDKFVANCYELSGTKKVKSLFRTHHEARHSPFSGYILNYDKILTTTDKIAYLTKMGHLNPLSEIKLSAAQIDMLYDKTKNYYLDLLDLDIGSFS